MSLDRPNVIIIGDFLKDLDDEHTLCVAAKLHRDGVINLLCVVGNLKPAELRARGAKGTLKQLGLPDIPVGVGSMVFEDKTHPYETDVPYLANPSEVEPYGLGLLASLLETCPDKSVVLVLQSGLTDAMQLLIGHTKKFRTKIASVAIMGGVEFEKNGDIKVGEHGIVPNNANNHSFDMEAATDFYKYAQGLGIPLVVTTRDAAYACQLPFTVYDQMEETGNAVGACLKGRQQPALQKLWQAACSPAGAEIRGTLPNDRNRQWFINVFCSGNDPGIPDGEDIWPYVGCFNLYDPINLVAAVPQLRERFFEPTAVTTRNFMGEGVTHLVIGVSKDKPGIRDVDALRQFLIESEVGALKDAAYA
jgi:hypothetical protein